MKDDDKWLNDLLRGNARTIYLTIHALPKQIRPCFTVGFLLAKLADTVVDETNLSPSEKRKILDRLQEELANDHTQYTALSIPMDKYLAPTKSQVELIEHHKQLVAYLRRLPQDVRQPTIEVLSRLLRGQQLGTSLGSSNELHCLNTVDELKNYCYLAAGCVGEYWTKISYREIEKYSSIPEEELISLGIDYGNGLQLINVLRDFHQDLAKNLCLFPLEQLYEYGINLKELYSNPQNLTPIANYWWQTSINHLRNGWRYMLSINQPRIRYACALPLLIGFATLEKLEDMNYLKTGEHVKISRATVKRLMLIALLGSVSKRFFHLVRFFSFSHLIYH